MFQVKQEGVRMIIDVREMVKRGMHPRKEIIDCVRNASKGTIFEIHLPHPGQPLISAIEQLGLDCVLNQLGPGHFRLLTLKME